MLRSSIRRAISAHPGASPRIARRFKSCGIVGLPNVGKSALFNALTKTMKAQSANFPFCTIDPNSATVAVPDNRLQQLAKVEKSQKITYQTMEFVDIAGLIKGASKGEGLGNKFLGNIRHCSMILHLLRCFDSEEIIHVHGKTDPIADMATIETELILADLQSLEKRKPRDAAEGAVLKKCIEALNAGSLMLDALSDPRWSFTDSERDRVEALQLLTMKPMAVICNVDEAAAKDGNAYSRAVQQFLAERASKLVAPPSKAVATASGKAKAASTAQPAAAGTGKPPSRAALHVCARLEEDAIRSFPTEDAQKEFLQLVNLEQTSLDKVIALSSQMLGLHSFYTLGPTEARCWPIRRGATAVEAAAKIHSDIAKGFVLAEVMKADDIMRLGGEAATRAAGLVRQEKKEYVVQEGDVILFKFSASK